MIAPRRHPSNRPFLAAPRPEFYHPAKLIDTALQSSERAIRRGEGVGLVVGAPGTGKSLLLAKIAESVRDDFDVALLSGARICTRRALWQSILAEVGEPYRGIDEAELRINMVERIRGLAATGAGLVVLVDEAHTLPTRLIEELRLLTNVPTPLPAVHIVLAGTSELEEILAAPKMESLSQRIAVRSYLEPLEHSETLAYLRTQTSAAALNWDTLFEHGCDDAVFTASDGVPRLINQICDQTLVLVSQAGRQRATPADIAAAWREIQRLPSPSALGQAPNQSWQAPAETVDFFEDRFSADGTTNDAHSSQPNDLPDFSDGLCDSADMIEFGSPESDSFGDTLFADKTNDVGGPYADPGAVERALLESFGSVSGDSPLRAAKDPWQGPDVELIFDSSADPFAEYFADEERVVERFLMRGPDDFSHHHQVASREGLSMAKQLGHYENASLAMPAAAVATVPQAAIDCVSPLPASLGTDHEEVDAEINSQNGNAQNQNVIQTDTDDTDMVVIEEDAYDPPRGVQRSIFAVRPGDYRHLFARLRRGD